MGSDAQLLPISRHRVSDASRMRVRLAALFGFVLGFGMAFVTLLTYGDSVIEILSERPTTMIVVTTGEGSSSAVIAESEVDLYSEVRVICMILTFAENHDKAFHLNATWGKRCNQLIFISDEDDPELGAVNLTIVDGHDNLWAKTREAFRYVYENFYEEGDWFLKADDDTYVIMENLRYFLYGYDTEKPIYFGHKLKFNDKIYMSGGSGYVLSKEALHRFMTEAFNNTRLCDSAIIYPEDMQMGSCLTNVGVQSGNSMDLIDGTQRFHPLQLNNYVQPKAIEWLPNWIYNRTVDPILTGPFSVSEYATSFHYMQSREMYLYDSLLYRIRVYGFRKAFRALPVKGELVYMSGGGGYVLSKEALRLFMTDAFNDTDLCYGPLPQSEDYQMANCLTNVGVKTGNSMDLIDGTERFFPLRFGDYIQPNNREWLPDWLFNRSTDPILTGPSCCSQYAISFHYIEPKTMYVYDALLYRMRVHGKQNVFRPLPQKGRSFS